MPIKSLLNFIVGINVESFVWGIRRNQDKTLEVIVAADSFKEIITPEVIQSNIIDILKKK